MTFTFEIDDEDVLAVFYEAEDAIADCDLPVIEALLAKLRDGPRRRCSASSVRVWSFHSRPGSNLRTFSRPPTTSPVVRSQIGGRALRKDFGVLTHPGEGQLPTLIFRRTKE